ncbi:YggT family protein [Desulfosporosinus sp. BICA1-9]|uniref:YggT family protein n=1 Tax=Desulfosporosinus sp. BICA1-9 TaxID=1531958 RepID=UPI000B0A2F8A|nr:YggT family protein [Desulfosporosinus sp. BICA1-9]
MNESSVMNTDPKNLQAKRIVYYILGVLQVLLAFRLIFKLLGANPQSPFVSFIYSVSQAFLIPFNGIFRSAVTKGIEAQSVLEPTTIIAMIVYAIIAWGIVKLIEIRRPAHSNEIR